MIETKDTSEKDRLLKRLKDLDEKEELKALREEVKAKEDQVNGKSAEKMSQNTKKKPTLFQKMFAPRGNEEEILKKMASV